MRTSAYTRASLHPLATAATVAGLGLAAAAILRSRRRGGPSKLWRLAPTGGTRSRMAFRSNVMTG